MHVSAPCPDPGEPDHVCLSSSLSPMEAAASHPCFPDLIRATLKGRARCERALSKRAGVAQIVRSLPHGLRSSACSTAKS
jgi:hypothetical protein